MFVDLGFGSGSGCFRTKMVWNYVVLMLHYGKRLALYNDQTVLYLQQRRLLGLPEVE